MPRLNPKQVAYTRPLEADDAIAALNGRPDSKGQALVCCPSHDDLTPSLSVGSKDDGSVLVNCHAGCPATEVLFALKRLAHDDVALERYRASHSEANRSFFRETGERYAYPGGVYKAVGELFVYEADGSTPRVIKERAKMWRKDNMPCPGSRQWFVPGGLQLATARELRVVSSESDAAALTKAGFPAVSVPNGDQGNIPEPIWPAEARLVVLGDNDPSGQAWAERASAALGAVRGAVPPDFKDARAAIEAGEDRVAEWEETKAAEPVDAEFESFVAAEQRLLKARRVARDRDEAERRAEVDGLGDNAMDAKSLSPADIRALPALRYVLKGLLPEDNIAVMAGKEATFKSFVAFDWAAHIATGRDWFGRKVKPGHAAIIAAEGGSGYGQRLKAWESQHGVEVPDDALTVFPDRIDASAPGSADAIIRWLKRRGGARILVVDTLRKVSGGADENSAREMGLVLDNLDRVRKAVPGIAVLVIHHNNKNGSMRGSSAIAGDIDTVLSVVRGEGLTTVVRIDKQKDGRDGFALELGLRAVEIGVDEDGEKFASLAVLSARELVEGEVPEGTGPVTRTLPIIRKAGSIGMGQTEIANELGGSDAHKGTVSEDVKWLHKAGLIARGKKPAGSKSRSVNWWVVAPDDA